MADSVFGDLGGPGQQHGTRIPDPEGGPDPHMASAGSVFGDLGGGGVAVQTRGPEIPNSPGRDPGGQAGR